MSDTSEPSKLPPPTTFLFTQEKHKKTSAYENNQNNFFNNSSSFLPTTFTALPRTLVKYQLSNFERLDKAINHLWDLEISQYEDACNYKNFPLKTDITCSSTSIATLYNQWCMALFPECYDKHTSSNNRSSRGGRDINSSNSSNTNNNDEDEINDDHYYKLQDAFPYHTDLYPLRTCLEALPRQPINLFDNMIEDQSPCSSSSIRSTLLPPWRISYIETMQHLMSEQNGLNSLHSNNDEEEEKQDEIPLEDESFQFISMWECCLLKQDPICGIPDTTVSNQKQVMQIILLLRILRHAISDMQIDLRLGRAIILLFAENKYLDLMDAPLNYDSGTDHEENQDQEINPMQRPSVLLYLLTVMKMDYVKNCNSNCGMTHTNIQQSHSCIDVAKFMDSLSTLISCGITTLSNTHATTLSAFVLYEYNTASSAVALMDDSLFDSSHEFGVNVDHATHFVIGQPTENSVGNKANSSSSGATSSSKTRIKPSKRKRNIKLLQKDLLKQNLYFIQNSINTYQYHHHSNDSVPVTNRTSAVGEGVAIRNPFNEELFRTKIILSIIRGLGLHALSDRRRMQHLHSVLSFPKGEVTEEWIFDDDDADADGNTSDIEEKGEKIQLTLKNYLLVQHSWMNCVRALVDIGEHTVRRLPQNLRCMEIGGQIVKSMVDAHVEYWTVEKGISNPVRYAHSIVHASDSIYDLKNRWENMGILTPHKDVQDAVRSLYLRGLVDLSVSKCGFGDWLVWCNLPVNPLDPLLYDHGLNYNDDETRYGSMGYYEDEDGRRLKNGALAARYDFSLLMLLRAWRAPWTPESHLSFSKSCRLAINTLAMCCNHYCIPSELLIKINSYISRKWWPNQSQRKCWGQECQQKELYNTILEKVTMRERKPSKMNMRLKNMSIEECPGCEVAMYCCEEHKRYLYQDGHKRFCGTPPFRPPGKEEENLCKELATKYHIIPPEYLINSKDENEETTNSYNSFNVDDDDSSCWESVNSEDDEEEPSTATELIHTFFLEQSRRKNTK